MSENKSQPPVPPSRFSSETGVVRSVTSVHAFGADLVRDEAHNLDQEFKASDEAFAKEYWEDMQEFYGLDDEDAERLTLEDASEKYDFSPASRDHIKNRRLGSYTLNAAREDANYWTNSDRSYNQERLERNIKNLRDVLSVTLSDPHNNFMLNLYMMSDAPPIFNHMRTAPDGVLYRWREWLEDKATPEQFMNFVQWHNYHMNELNTNPEVQAEIVREKAEYKAAVKKFVDEGELPATAVKIEEVDYCKVYIGDVFATLMQGRAGYYPSADAYPRNRYVVVDKNNIEHATKHELNHAVMTGYKDRWLNEAVTEHLAVSMRNSRVELVGDVVSQGVYNEERALLDAVMTGGSEDISTKTLLWGYAEEKYHLSKDQFEKAVDAIWGYGALNKIQSTLEGHENRLIADMSRRDAQKEALAIVRSDLLQQPETILGKNYIAENKVLA